MSAGSYADIAANLMDFQRRTVEHVLDRLYRSGDDCGDRFLVADEVGMGKTHVAKGVIAGAIEHLQDDDSVDRIDVVYICSNAEIARQNLAKLGIHGGRDTQLDTRMTLLATQTHDLNAPSLDGRKPVNLIAFTPGTSFAKGHSGGRVSERALLHVLLEPLLQANDRGMQKHRRALGMLLIGQVGAERWERAVAYTHSLDLDQEIAEQFRQAVSDGRTLVHLLDLVDDTVGRQRLSEQANDERNGLVGTLRDLLAHSSIDALEPDLVILDEFQRFKHLLDAPDPGDEAEVSGLAHRLFSYPCVKVLLLSATPYKMVTLPEETALTGDEHYTDFLATIRFLGGADGPRLATDVERARSEFRHRMLDGEDQDAARQRLESLLLRVMCRTERPTLERWDMVTDRNDGVAAPSAEDFAGYATMHAIAELVDAPLPVEYWKSAPYFLNFMDGYRASERVRDFLSGPSAADLDPLLREAQLVRAAEVESRGALSWGNARLAALAADTVERGWWQLLWVPPSLPYYEVPGPYAEVGASMTKRLIFSSWAAAPTAIAALLSHEATRRMTDGTDVRGMSARLNYETDGGSLTTLAVFAPSPGLAAISDPLAWSRSAFRNGETATLGEVTRRLGRRLLEALPDVPQQVGGQPVSWFGAAPFLIPTSREHSPSYASLLERLAERNEQRSHRGLEVHLLLADRLAEGDTELGHRPQDLGTWLATVGLAGPGNAAWRALHRLVGSNPGISAQGLLSAASIIGEGFRALFNRPEVMTYLDREFRRDDEVYWQTVVRYCAGGNVQAVLDEYLSHLVAADPPTDDDQLIALARSIEDVVALRPADLEAFDPTSPEERIGFSTRFALRYGNAKGTATRDEKGSRRLSAVQDAFNSPFRPFVLASTSVGQEGVDFHWWCHSLVHWNLPANPVDLDQREGRVHRYMGHAIRKNIAANHRDAVLSSDHADPWSVAIAAARAARPADATEQIGDMWPGWVFPGPATIERWTPTMPLSRDIERLRRLKQLRGLYRLAFGQPRQDDLLESLERVGEGTAGELGVNLSPSPSGHRQSSPATRRQGPPSRPVGVRAD